MKVLIKRLGFSRFESLLGFGLLALVVLVVLPPMQGGLNGERPLRAVMQAEIVAKAVLDYHTDLGHWPISADGQADLALLVPVHKKAQARAVAGSMNSATEGTMMGTLVESETTQESPVNESEKAWLKEVPVDPWDRPFRVVVMGERTGYQAESKSSGYPDEPPAGTAIVVISAGPNGLYDTDLAKLWQADLSGRLNLASDQNTPQEGNAFGGDDLGFVLSRSAIGGTQ